MSGGLARRTTMAAAAQGGRTANPLRRTGSRLVAAVLSRIAFGRLTVRLPDGTALVGRGEAAGPEAELHLLRWRALRRLLAGGDIGFAEAFIEGEWCTDDLPALIALAIVNEAPLWRMLNGAPLLRGLNRLRHLRRRNTRAGARRNVEAHYDLGNAFYASFLDPEMNYSSALYASDDVDLDAAQRAKQDRVVALLDAAPGDRVLEIGCGWGALARRLSSAAAQVVAITLSVAQERHARAACAVAIARGALDLRLQDYRDVEGAFDRVVSIEMIEAVGEAHWPAYFGTIAARLRPGGRAVLQAITIDAARFEAYRATPDFIQRYVFPGGMLPTVPLIASHAASAGLVLAHQERFGRDYARTLAQWRTRFMAARPGHLADGMSLRFARKWEYYLAYCEAGFRTGSIDVGLYVLEKPA